MAQLTDPAVSALLTKPNHAILSTLNADGSIHSATIWLDVEDGRLALNSARGRAWPTNLERDPTATVLLLNEDDPYEYVEIRGTAELTDDGADEQIDTLAQKYINQEKYPWRTPGERRVKVLITPTRVRHAKAG
jgi:PPOX class probable F420-dependent enzyme